MTTSSIIKQFTPTARVWIYAANKPFAQQDISAVQTQLNLFAKNWASHNNQLTAAGELLYNRFVVLTIDEAQMSASGCSIDSSVNFIKELGAQYNRDLFDRFRFSYIDKDGVVQTVSKDEFSDLYAKGNITDETIVFDPLVNTVAALETSFQKPLKDSWHKRFV